MIIISNQTARKLALHQQGLLSAKPKFGLGKKAVIKALEHLGYVQIDAISVIQRAHHHTLWSRIPNYQPKFLNQLLSRDGKIFEYWSHAVSFLPMKHYPFYLPMMHSFREKERHWYQVDESLKSQVLKRIESDGPLYARDFETPASSSKEMWGWKPAKKALHELFMEGKLAVASRDGFQRKYDLAERVIPWYRYQQEQEQEPSRAAGGQQQDSNIDLASAEASIHPHRHPHSISVYIQHRCLQAIRAHGLVSVPEIRYQRDISASDIENSLTKLEAEGLVRQLKVERTDRVYWTSVGSLEDIPVKVYKQIHFLSPFDNAVIQRKRIGELFNFEYQTEIYYPVNKRKYGYFSLPILYGTDFIGRMDPKALRDQKILQINNLALESRVKMDDMLISSLRNKLQDFARFNQCEHFTIVKSTPSALKSILC